MELPTKKLSEYFRFLDYLRISGVTNMYGASPYLVEEFDLPRNEAKAVLSAWMQTFDDSTPEGRAEIYNKNKKST